MQNDKSKFKISQRIKFGIFDFTDCEGCQVEIFNLMEKVIDIKEKFDIKYWRLAKNNVLSVDEIDVAIVEGLAMSDSEIAELKKIRSISKYLIALGACAGIAGIPGIAEEKEREKMLKYVYKDNYKPLVKNNFPISHWVKVDGYIPGCPALPRTIEKFFSQLLAGKIMEPAKHTVCKECKLAGRKCFLLEGRTCLGPITQSSCGAICLKSNYPCYGCYGPIKDAQIDTLKKLVKDKDRNEIMELFLKKVTSHLKE